MSKEKKSKPKTSKPAKGKAAPAKAQRKQPAESEEVTLINFKTTKGEKKALQTKANKFADGNLSFWLRYAALNHTPKKTDMAV